MSTKPLHSLERRLLKTLRGKKEGSRLEAVAEKAGLSLDQTRRAVEWLKAKELLAAEAENREVIMLDTEGQKAAAEGLPERRLLEQLTKTGGEASLEDLKKRFSGDAQEFSAALGNARKQGWVEITSVDGKPVAKGQAVKKATLEEMFLSKLAREGGVAEADLAQDEKMILKILEKRPGYLKRKEEKTVKISLTSQGSEVAAGLGEEEELDKLTPDILATGKWKGHVLRPIDVEAPAPPIYPGKKHPVQQFIDEVREIFVALGFEEIEGPIIQPSFWNFDTLFIPQDHPAREMQDTFYLADAKSSQIGGGERVVQSIAQVHENGGNTGSRGWGYRWNVERAKETVLRTHTTAVTVKYLADHRPRDARVFSVGRVFRNEKTNFKHLDEFYQIEGIAVGEKVSMRDLMGLLSRFYLKLGLTKVKFWPTFFPYTEPSLQSMVYFENLGKWVELCGMGIFRPEVTLPLGVKNPVLAWGGGLERLVMLRHGITDIRVLYDNSLSWLRGLPLCR
ncbi:MAG: phenylalanine--tRNA ligase subunit alpha [Thaumarchaeota archaeon]|nr:phenylalanine--tRNA ligase subunit alpha [Nitrososphaerota archaeon]